MNLKLLQIPFVALVLVLIIGISVSHGAIQSRHKMAKNTPMNAQEMLYRVSSSDLESMKNSLARIFHEKEMANPFQAYKIRLNANSKKGIRRDRLYTHPTRFPRFQTS